MIEDVLRIIQMGYKVFPVRCKDKIPLTAHGHLDASKNQDQIKDWWTQFPDANIGLLVGEEAGICILDIDPRNGGDNSLSRLIETYGNLPATVEVISGGGGRHFYFLYNSNFFIPSEFKNGIDIKKKGYIVIPPSLHASGNRYGWVEGKALGKMGLANPPSFLIKTDNHEQIQKESIVDIYKGVSEGDRHNSLIRYVGSWLGRNTPLDECLAIAWAVNKQFNPPLDENEVKAIVTGLYQKETAKRVSDQPDALKGFGVTPIGKIKESRLRWLIKDVIPRNVLVFISAMPKAGKSTLALSIAISLSTGMLFLGYFLLGRRKPCKVILISLEDHPGEVKAKAEYFLQGRRFPNKLLLMLKANTLNLPNDFKRLKLDIEDEKPDVVILDTLRRSHQLKEDASTDMAPIMQGLRELIREHHITPIVIHHSGHYITDKNNSGDWLRGTSDFNASWEALIALEKTREDIKVRIFHKYRSRIDFNYKAIKGESIDPITGDYPIVNLVYAPPDDSKHKQIEEKILKALADGPKSGNDLEKWTRTSRSNQDDVLSKMQDKEKVKIVGKGRSCKWTLVSQNRPKLKKDD